MFACVRGKAHRCCCDAERHADVAEVHDRSF
jgi:hypothetical protein